MEFTACPRMLRSQPTGSTETQTRDVRIQSPTHHPLGHHVSYMQKKKKKKKEEEEEEEEEEDFSFRN